MRRLLASLPFVLLIAACSPSEPPHPIAPSGEEAPGHAVLGSPEWNRWVDQSLGIGEEAGSRPAPGTPAWNTAVQRKLGEEAPQLPPGSPPWQQAVDALVRTRVTPP